MTELRSVDPRTLKPNPNNPRRTPVPPAMDEQLVASIKAIGIIQPPVVREADGELIVKAGGRRVKAAITAELAKGTALVEAVGRAKKFVTEAIRSNPGLGSGSGPLNHFAR